jgi:hypothetical protein
LKRRCTQKNTFSEFICGRWYSCTGDDLKNAFSRSTKQFLINWKICFFVEYRKNGCLIFSLADNWDLDKFKKKKSFTADDISSMTADYHPQWLIMVPSGWISSPVVDCNFKSQPSKMIFDSIEWISFRSDEYRLL